MQNISATAGAVLLAWGAWGGAGLPAAGEVPAGEGNQEATVPGTTDDGLSPGVRTQLEAVDPLVVGWTSEALNSSCGNRLNELAALLQVEAHLEAATLEGLVVDEYAGGILRPEAPTPVFADGAFDVRRGLGKEPPTDTPVRGRDGLADELTKLIAPLWGDGHAGHDLHFHFKFKIIRVEDSAEGVRTDVYYAADGAADGHLVEQSATWRVEWTPETAEAPHRIRSITAWDFEEVTARVPGRTLFTDCTGSVFVDDPTFEAQFGPGIDHWRARMIRSMGQPLLGHPAGIAVGDVNGDGLEDLFFCQPGGLPNRLYLNAGDGTVKPGPEPNACSVLDFTRSALFLDWDNDGDRDLVMTTGMDAVFFANDGTGKFTWKAMHPAPATTMLAAADYDNDGDLDLYITGYSTPYDGESWPVPYHDAENGQRNILLRNDGRWQPVDATDEVGLGAHNTRFSFAASWEDFDNDGDQDLYVANDFGRNCLYRNDGGKFVDVAPAAGVEDISAGMSTNWGDFNGDGWMDVFVSNMFSSAGNRVTYNRRFNPDMDEEVRGEYRRHSRGNTLFLNSGDGTFRDVSVEAGITMGRWAWGSIFTDFNNDGRLDMIVPNGFLTNTISKDL